MRDARLEEIFKSQLYTHLVKVCRVHDIEVSLDTLTVSCRTNPLSPSLGRFHLSAEAHVPTESDDDNPVVLALMDVFQTPLRELRDQCINNLESLGAMHGRSLSAWVVVVATVYGPLIGTHTGRLLYSSALEFVSTKGGALVPDLCAKGGSTSTRASALWKKLASIDGAEQVGTSRITTIPKHFPRR